MNRTNRTDEMELAGWQEAWLQLGGRDGLAIELAARARKAARRHRGYQVLSVTVSIGVMLDMAWMVTHTRGSRLAVFFSIAMSLILGVILTRLFTDRIGRAGSTLESFVALTRARIARDLRWNTFKRRIVWILGGVFVPWFIVACMSRRAIFRTSPLHVALYITAILGGLTFELVRNAQKRRALLREREELETLVAERTLV